MAEVKHPAAKRIVDYLRGIPPHAATPTELFDFRDREGIGMQEFKRARDALLEHGAVRWIKFQQPPISGPFKGMDAVYYLVSEFAKPR